MNELRSLLLLELRSLYGINKALHTKDKKARNRYWLLGSVWALLFLMVFGYVGGLVFGLCSLGLGSIVPAYLITIASLLILVFGLFTAGHRIFGQRGYEILASLPVKSSAIVISRFLSLYVEDLILTMVILLPGTVVYGICLKPDIRFYLTAFLGSLFIPAIPLVISVLPGTLITALSARMKGRNMMQTLLTVAFTVVVLVWSFSLNESNMIVDPEALKDLANTVSKLIGQIYPPAVWLGDALVQSDLLGLGLFIVGSVLVFGAAVFLVSKLFHNVLVRLASVSTQQNYQISTMESRSLMKALYIRELKRYFSSSIYVTNTIIGPIMALILSVAVCITGPEFLHTVAPGVNITALLPYLLATVLCMMTTTSVSISMEGRQFWVVKSLPIPAKALLDSKIALNLTLTVPCYVASVVTLAIGTGADALQLLWLLLIPGTIMVFSVVFGITVNLKLHSFDWQKEEYVVKQSLPAALGGFAGPLVSIVLGVVHHLLPWITTPMLVLLLILTAVLYRTNNRTNLSNLS